MSKKKKAPTLLYRVQLEDEMPAIGSGWRWVYAREGHKWAFILCPFTINTVRIPLSKWQGIKRARWEKESFILAGLKARLDKLERSPTAFELSAFDPAPIPVPSHPYLNQCLVL